MRRRVGLALLIWLVACTGGGRPAPLPSLSVPVGPTPHFGGEAVFGTQYWPECINPITSCGASEYTHFAVLQHILPRAMQLDVNGNFVASPLLVEAPSLSNGGLTQNPFTVRFGISPAARWDDGSPITAEDFAFTWRAILHTTSNGRPAAYRHDAYAHVLAVDTSDPRTAVIRFSGVYMDWPDLFGGAFDYVLKAAAFPNADREAPNLYREMTAYIPFSAGPFRLESWSLERAVLARNPSYFGPQARLDRVTFIPLFDQDAFTSLLQGRISAIIPEVWSRQPADHAPEPPNVKVLGGDGTIFEALWINHRDPPLSDPKVREALMYAIDRQSVVDTLVKEWNKDAEVLNCGLVALPGVGPWCRTQPFAGFTYNPGRSRSILESDGYDCSATFCAKDGKVLTVEYDVYQNNVRRTLTQSLLSDKARAAGFAFELRTYGSGLSCCDVNGFPMVDAGIGGSADPSTSPLFSCDEVRSQQNPGGENFIGWCDPKADELMKRAGRELDPAARLALMDRVYQREADDFVSLPLFVVPAVGAWRTDEIAGPIGEWNSSPYGLFFNMDQWFSVSG